MSESFFLKVSFRDGDKPNEEAIDKLVAAIADELVWLKSRRQTMGKNGWGMSNADGSSHNLIASVTRHEPVQQTRALVNRALDVKLISGVDGVMWPDNAVKGRFLLRGTVLKGVKAALGRTVEIKLTADQLRLLVNQGADMLLRYRNTGTTPGEDT